jgi:predicted RNA-binding Zn-ribbon protein involved in translation (DUF1610 family)
MPHKWKQLVNPAEDNPSYECKRCGMKLQYRSKSARLGGTVREYQAAGSDTWELEGRGTPPCVRRETEK